MIKNHDYKFATLCIHGGLSPEEATGAVMTPIFQTSTYAQISPGQHKGYEYSRTQNPTRKALENSLAALEQARFGFCFSSGCAAATILLLGLEPGDHVISMEDLYGGTHRLFKQIFARFGINFSYADLSSDTNFDRHITPKTKMIWIESPTNPLLKLVDIEKITAQAKKSSILVTVDNTFATPALQNPLLLGADFVVHSTTKYIGGHSDVLGGAILTNNKDWAEKIAFISNAIGATPAPLDCFLLLRGIKTLHLRMKQHSENAQFLAEKLIRHPNIEKVIFPGLMEHPQYELVKTQMRGPSGMISLIIKGGEQPAKKVCEKTRIFVCAESLGGVESLIEHPTSMTHAALKPAERLKIGIDDGLVRLSVGIEDKQDLLSDLEQALN